MLVSVFIGLIKPTLLAATVAAGLSAGFFLAFAHTVMPGLASTDDATYVRAFQSIDRSVTNPWFLLSYVVGPILTIVALAILLADRQWAVASLVGVAALLSVTTWVITAVVHLPLNNQLQHVALSGANLADERHHFAQRWVPWNVVRTVTSCGAFVSLTVALLRIR